MSADDPYDEHRGYGNLLEAARSLSVADTHLDSPPAEVWTGIEALVAAGRANRVGWHATTPSTVAPHHTGARITRRTRRGRATQLVGAAAALVATVVGLHAFAGRDNTPGASALDAISLSNDGLASVGAASSARATLVAEADGHYALDLDVSRLPATDGFFELWIIDRRVQGMYSLGPLHGSGHYPLPDNVAPANFPIVDVSIEPSDGVPQHSGVSILRGTLTI